MFLSKMKEDQEKINSKRENILHIYYYILKLFSIFLRQIKKYFIADISNFIVLKISN